jgi:hypothetical protein
MAHDQYQHERHSPLCEPVVAPLENLMKTLRLHSKWYHCYTDEHQ